MELAIPELPERSLQPPADPVKDLEHEPRVRIASTSGPSEFGAKGRSTFVREAYAVERDFLNVYVALTTLARHMANFETLLCFVLSIGSTCFFTLYSPDPDFFLAERLDFTLIGTAVVFPISFLINETFRRRELALQRIAHIKALLCQIQAGMLLWRWKNSSVNHPTKAWEDEVNHSLRGTMRDIISLLRLPKWSANRHTFTAQGRLFRRNVVNNQRELTSSVIANVTRLHAFVEDLKELGLTASEATRLNQYTYLLQMEFEGLVMIKTYRTTNIARSFVRIVTLLCPTFYGPYFCWIARSSVSGDWTAFSLTYALLLTIATTFVLQGLVKVQRALEDPFVSPFAGEAIALAEEEHDTNIRIDMVLLTANDMI